MNIRIQKLLILLGLMICFSTSCEFSAIQELPYIDLKSGFFVSAPVAREGQAINFSNTATSVAKLYEWDFGDGATSTEANPSHAYTKYGRYKVTLTVRKEDKVLVNSFSQDVLVIPPTAWNTNAKLFGDEAIDEQGFCFTPIVDFNVASQPITGYLLLGRRGVNVLRIIRTDVNFNPVWSSPIDIDNITQGAITPRAVIQTKDTSFVIAGSFTYNLNDEDAFMLKIANETNRSLVKERWRKVRNTSQIDLYTSLVEFSGDILVGGSTLVTDAQGSATTKLLVETYEKDGNLKKSDIYGSNWQINAADFGTQGFAFALTEGVGGSTRPSLIFYSTSFVEKRKRTLTFLDGRATDVATVLNGAGADAGQILVGNYNENFTNELGVTQEVKHAFIARLNDFGFMQWGINAEPEEQRIRKIIFYKEEFTKVLQVTDGFVAVGIHENPLSGKDILLCKYDNNGVLLKYKLVGNADEDGAVDAKLISPTDFVIFGSTQSTLAPKRRNFYLLKLNKDLE